MPGRPAKSTLSFLPRNSSILNSAISFGSLLFELCSLTENHHAGRYLVVPFTSIPRQRVVFSIVRPVVISMPQKVIDGAHVRVALVTFQTAQPYRWYIFHRNCSRIFSAVKMSNGTTGSSGLSGRRISSPKNCLSRAGSRCESGCIAAVL